jgi:hypothetical protein
MTTHCSRAREVHAIDFAAMPFAGSQAAARVDDRRLHPHRASLSLECDRRGPCRYRRVMCHPRPRPPHRPPSPTVWCHHPWGPHHDAVRRHHPPRAHSPNGCGRAAHRFSRYHARRRHKIRSNGSRRGLRTSPPSTSRTYALPRTAPTPPDRSPRLRTCSRRSAPGCSAADYRRVERARAPTPRHRRPSIAGCCSWLVISSTMVAIWASEAAGGKYAQSQPRSICTSCRSRGFDSTRGGRGRSGKGEKVRVRSMGRLLPVGAVAPRVTPNEQGLRQVDEAESHKGFQDLTGRRRAASHWLLNAAGQLAQANALRALRDLARARRTDSAAACRLARPRARGRRAEPAVPPWWRRLP